MKSRHGFAAATAAIVSIAALAGCTATPDGNPSGGDSGSGSGTDIVSLVAADERQTGDELTDALGEPSASDGTTLCYVTRTLANEFWGYERDGFEERAEELGVEYQTFAVNDESSITEQLDKAKSAMTQGCSAILASPISASGLDSVFQQALADGIPAIVLNDAKSSVPGVVYVGPDAEEIGEQAADYIAEQLPDGGKVAQVEGDPGSSNALNRGKGFKAALEGHDGLELVASQTAKWDANQAKTIATAMLTTDPDIKAFYSQNDGMALGIQSAIAEKGLTGDVMLVGTDGIPEAKRLISDGKYTATVSERPKTEAATGVDVALWLLAGEEVPAWVDVPAFIVDESNVDEYLEGMP